LFRTYHGSELESRRPQNSLFNKNPDIPSGQEVAINIKTGNCFAPERVLLHGLTDGCIQEEPPWKTWGRFFPEVLRSERDYPRPYSLDFWRLYAEPVRDFYRAAKCFSDVAVGLQLGGRHRDEAIQHLDLLRRGTWQRPEGDVAERIVLHWSSPSLLADFAQMRLEDEMAGRPVIQCETCHEPMIATGFQQKYCSLKCRYRGQKARVRSEQKKARAMRIQGSTLAQIAEALGRDRDTIKRWVAKSRTPSAIEGR
jgi:hypothetical protein